MDFDNPRTILKLAGGIVLSLFTAVAVISAAFSVDQAERAVVTRFGKIDRIADPGLNFKLPFVEGAHTYRTDIRSLTPKAAANTYTIDNQEVDVRFTLFYRIPAKNVGFIYENAPDYEARLMNMAIDRLKSEMGKINVEHLAAKRGEVRDNIKSVLAKAAEALGVQITDFQLTDLQYTQSFRHAVESAAQAKAMVETREQERIQALKTAETARITAEGQANAIREKAKGDADARLLNATAEAKAIKLQGEAQADAIKAQAEALAQNGKLVELRKAERWDGKLPQQLLSGIVPFMEFTAPGQSPRGGPIKQ